MHHPHETMREAKSHSKNVIHSEETEEKKDSNSPKPTQPKPPVDDRGKKKEPEAHKAIPKGDNNYKDKDGNWRNKHGELIHDDDMVG